MDRGQTEVSLDESLPVYVYRSYSGHWLTDFPQDRGQDNAAKVPTSTFTPVYLISLIVILRNPHP